MPNWEKLIRDGRARAHGIPCTAEELAARALGIPKEYYLDGVYTLEEYAKVLKKEEKEGKPLERQSRDEVAAVAAEAGVVFTPDAPASALVKEVKKRGKK